MTNLNILRSTLVRIENKIHTDCGRNGQKTKANPIYTLFIIFNKTQNGHHGNGLWNVLKI